MQGEPTSQARLDALWASLHEAVADCAWDAAEGLLLRFLQLAPSSPLEVWDTLGYVLLMQGDYGGCLAALEPRRADPTRSFWLEHKLGDAHRGLNQLELAVGCYRRSLLDGSDSPLTCRNLLQVLDGLDPALATTELRQWQQAGAPSSAAWEGARRGGGAGAGPGLSPAAVAGGGGGCCLPAAVVGGRLLPLGSARGADPAGGGAGQCYRLQFVGAGVAAAACGVGSAGSHQRPRR